MYADDTNILEIHATKNATIFWEHEVFVDCCHSNTTEYLHTET